MSILKYGDYISEKAVYELLLESKVVYSKKFINLLNKMKANKLATQLLSLYSKDVDGVTQNYIDITDLKDAVSFTPDRKVQELTKDKPETWVITESGKYLTTSDRNNKIFEALGYDKAKYNCWAPSTGEIGLILAETVSTTSGKIYVMFQEYKDTDPRIGVINKAAMEPKEAEDQRIWSTSRNNIKIGRLVRAILTASKIPFADSEIFFGAIAEKADGSISLIPDFIANCGMARVFAYLMSNDIRVISDKGIFEDTSVIIQQALQKTHAVHSGKTGIAKAAFEIALKQLV